jgi:WD40 repeat protein
MSASEQSDATIFEAARKLPPDERAAYLHEACGGDAALLDRVVVLLSASERANDFMAEPAALGVGCPSALLVPLTEKVGEKIGRYKLLQQIGEGGCGVVYMAEQSEPVRRRVALKVIKLGMDTRSVIARFEAERQALALMDHPNIARVIDAGATETGRPFFVMELVRGIKITDYCDQNNLSTAERLRLFIQVCHAVQHAHQKGIIHRDLKPSNILVTVNDGEPVPKVIDFGIAKATQGRLTDKTLVTAFEQFIGTPAYMSPEQAVMTSLDIDTRSDVYSLGVLLYEILTGQTPFDTQRLMAAGLDELRRTIREQAPLRPSTRLSTMADADLTRVAKARQTEPARLSSLVRGDLDWIAMKCLEKDRTRRYETANGLAKDIERHLNHQPVVARPPSRLYEFQKTVRRHWVGFAAAAGVVLVLALAVLVSAWEAIQARAAEREQMRLHQQAVKIGASATKALALAEQRLFEARLGQARAMRLRGAVGHRFESLSAIAEAASIRHSTELSDEALACLALTDLRVEKSLPIYSRWAAEQVQFDNKLELYAYPTNGGITVHDVANGQQVTFLRVTEANADTAIIRFLQFDPLSRYLCAQIVVGDGLEHCRVWDLTRDGTLMVDVPGDFWDFTPDGQGLAIEGEAGMNWIQDLAASKDPRRLNIEGPISQLNFSPDGRRMVGFEEGGSSVRIWDVSSGELLVSFLCSGEINVVTWNQDGSLVASGGVGGEINLWDVRRGELYMRLEGHHGLVNDLTFDHNGKLLASSAWDGTTRLWDVASGQQAVLYPKGVSDLRFSLDDRTLGCAVDATNCQLLEVAHPTGYQRLTTHLTHSGCRDLDFTADGRLLAIAGDNGIRLVDVLSGLDLGPVSRERSESVHLTSGTSSSLWTATKSGLYRWPLGLVSQAGQSLLRIESPERSLTQPLDTLAFDHDEKRLVASRNGAWLCDLQDSTDLPRFCPHPGAKYVAVDPAGRWVATGTWKGEGVKLWDFSNGRLIRDLPVSGSANVAASPDGNWLATVNSTEFRLWDTKSWSPAPEVLGANSVLLIGQLAFSPDSRILATCHDPAEIRLVRVPTFQPLARLPLPLGANISALRFSPNGDKLAALEWAGEVHLWDLRVIRSELNKLNLDWDLPPLAASAALYGSRGEHLTLDAGPFSRQELTRAIPPRDTNAPASLIDLTEYYNAPLTASWHDGQEIHNDLSDLPRGLQSFAHVEFDVRGLIQIGRGGARGLSYPSAVYCIPVGQPCRRLNFLHASINASAAHEGDEIGNYIIHYVDGRQVEIPIVVGKDLADWWSQPNEQGMKFVVAWTGFNQEVRKYQRPIRLFKTTWENPYPSVRIRQFDFISDKTIPASPFLVAVTADP